jgi:hypothetical protein
MDGQWLLVLVGIRRDECEAGGSRCPVTFERKDRKNDPFVTVWYDDSNPAVNTSIVSKNACVSG